MKKHEFRELVDQNLSGLVWDEEKRQTVLYAVQKEEKPVKKFTATFVLIAAVICLSVTALAAGLVFSSQVDAFKLAEKAVTDTYGITGSMLSTFFTRTAEETADGGVTVVYSGIEDLRAVLGDYTVSARNGRAAAAWSHEGEDTSGLFDAKAWGKEQLEEMFRAAAKDRDISAFVEKAELHAQKQETPSAGTGGTGKGDRKAGEAEARAAAKKSSYTEEALLALAKDAVASAYLLTPEQSKMLKLAVELEDMTDYTEDSMYYHMQDGRPVLTTMISLQQQTSGDPRVFPPFTEGDGVYWVSVNVETGVIEDILYDSQLGGNG